MENVNEIDIDTSSVSADERPISKHRLYGPRRFWGMYAAEHVAATEFVIGATFVAWGVGLRDVLLAILLGNLFAIASWMICAQVAVDTRLSLFSYMKRIAGPHMQKISNFINAIFFAFVAVAMTTITASGVREIFGVPIQVNWYPTSITFVILVFCVGMVIALISAFGFDFMTWISTVVGPWLLALFTVAGIVSIPIIVMHSSDMSGVASLSDIWKIGNTYVWVSNPDSPMTFWHVLAFACGPFGHHLALSDMTFFRYGKKNYGYTSIVAKFFGHGAAWLFAGVLGVAAAFLLNEDIANLDPGAVAGTVLGLIGSISIILAGVTTATPKLYRIGSALQTIFPNQSVKKMILISGVLISIVASFPFAFVILLESVAFLGAIVLPVGIIVATEHFIFPKIGYTPGWTHYKGLNVNKAFLYSWVGTMTLSIFLLVSGLLHPNFAFVPAIFVSMISYIILASMMGAKEDYTAEIEADRLLMEAVMAEEDKAALAYNKTLREEGKRSTLMNISGVLAGISLAVFIGSGILVYIENIELATFQIIGLSSSIAYFVFSLYFMKDALERKKA